MTQTAIWTRIGDSARKRPQLAILIFLALIMAITTPSFATSANIRNLFTQVSVIGILSCGLTLVVIGGALDLSVGSAVSLFTVISATLQLKSDVAAVLVPFAAAIVVGLFNGMLITSFNVNSIVVTLGSLSVIGGLALLYTNGAIIIGTPGTWYSHIADGRLLTIPYHVIIFVIIAIVCEFLLISTSFGRALRYVGTNPQAARVAGMRVKRVRIIAFLISAASAAAAGIVLSARMNSGSPVAGVGFEFDAITAIVIGGTSLSGGKGNIRSTIIGVFLLAVIVNGLRLYNVPFAFQNIVKGFLIILAITLDVRAKEKYGT